MPQSSIKLFLATIPSLVEKNQTVNEFWKWEESRPPFQSPGTGTKDPIRKSIDNNFKINLATNW
jgi:hypothetical protein